MSTWLERVEKRDTWADRQIRKQDFGRMRREAKKYGFTLDRDGTVTDRQDRRNTGHVSTARAAVETEGAIRDRFTVTRMVVLGVFALAFKKKTNDKQVFLTVSGDGFDFIAGPFGRRDEDDARKFAQRFNAVAADCAEFGCP
jgi:hypothetical protein